MKIKRKQRIVVDIENSVTRIEYAHAPDVIDNKPHNKNNSLVSIGILDVDTGEEDYVAVYHNAMLSPLSRINEVKKKIQEADLLIGHNIKYDLQWLWASGVTYSKQVYDTMIAEYILARGERLSVSLESCCERRNLENKKSDITKEYWKNGYGYEAMPWPIVEEYGRSDIRATRDLYINQLKDLDETTLQSTVNLSNNMCICLAEMEFKGLAININTLDKVERNYRMEKAQLTSRLQEIVYKYMGDTPLNLSSPEQVSSMIFSHVPINKKSHAIAYQLDRPFRPRIPSTKFKEMIRRGCKKIKKTVATHCHTCDGSGKLRKTRKDGSPYVKAHTCYRCGGAGTLYAETKETAGLKILPPDSTWATAHGFSTDKNRLKILSRQLQSINKNKYSDVIEFLEKIDRLGSVETYLSAFVVGIKKRIVGGILYAEFNQCRTATGRLSSSSPNMQNMPRGTTFPVKEAFVSRYGDEGALLEFDFAQLEFRVAAFLSSDITAIKEIETGFDVHTYTAKYLTAQGQPTSRQEAKGRTFAPLYGAMSGTPAEQSYNAHFIQKYGGIRKWHEKLQTEAIKEKSITLPTGRQFVFPNARRTRTGGSTGATKIKNYPVQAVATADIVPLCLVALRDRLNEEGVKSSIINTIHDSVLLDCPKEELTKVKSLVEEVLSTESTRDRIRSYYNIDMNVPLPIDTKVGDNWLDMS